MSAITRRFWVGEEYERKTREAKSQEERNAAFAEFQEEVRQKLSIADGHLAGGCKHEVVEAHGALWLRQPGNGIYGIPDPRQTVSRPGGDVMCECGGRAFTIAYGDYECLGTCVSCGKEWSLYSG